MDYEYKEPIYTPYTTLIDLEFEIEWVTHVMTIMWTHIIPPCYMAFIQKIESKLETWMSDHQYVCHTVICTISIMALLLIIDGNAHRHLNIFVCLADFSHSQLSLCSWRVVSMFLLLSLSLMLSSLSVSSISGPMVDSSDVICGTCELT